MVSLMAPCMLTTLANLSITFLLVFASRTTFFTVSSLANISRITIMSRDCPLLLLCVEFALAELTALDRSEFGAVAITGGDGRGRKREG